MEAEAGGTAFQKGLTDESASALKRYTDLAVGKPGLFPLLKYELLTGLLGGAPGAFGLWARKTFLRGLFRRAGGGVVIGRNVVLRHPNRIELGDRVLIDDGCVLDGRHQTAAVSLTVGAGTILSRNCVLSTKDGELHVGAACNFGAECLVYASHGRVIIEDHVLFAARCYIGGGRYHHDRLDVPIMEQGQYFKGDAVIERNCWIGAGAIVLDAVRVGHDSIIGAGSVVIDDIPPYSIAAGVPARVIRSRQDRPEAAPSR